jgi:katanin p60 ATPase-containing subunit A1
MRPDVARGLLAPWKTVLFYGPPGTGKTFLAKAVATECKRTFFNVTSATVTSKWHGESEKLIAYLFTLAGEMRPSTIFFDEIDSIASQRGGGSENEASRKMKAQLLTSIEGADSVGDSSVFILAATNFPWDLDEALLRRFQKRIYIPLPDAEGRETILKKMLAKEGEELADATFDWQMWARRLNGYSCSDVTNLCRDVVQNAAEKKFRGISTVRWAVLPVEDLRVSVTNADFEVGITMRKPSINRETLAKYEAWKMEKGAE